MADNPDATVKLAALLLSEGEGWGQPEALSILGQWLSSEHEGRCSARPWDGIRRACDKCHADRLVHIAEYFLAQTQV